MANPSKQPGQAPSPEAVAPIRPDPRRSLIEVLGVDLQTLPPAARAAIDALADEVIALRADRAALQVALSKAERLADRDTLCPIFNRRAFERELTREIALAERYGTPLCLIYVDLDRFKLINDRFGHATGDRVIQHVANALIDAVRQTDIVGRMGGDEFAIALTHATLPDCLAKAKALEQVIDGLIVRDGAEQGIEPVHLGASFGSVEWRAGTSADRLLALADETMFRAKADRRARR